MLDDPHRLEEAAELVHKLNAIAADLPPHDPKFERAKKRVLEAYTTIENNLIENFLNAYNYGQVKVSFSILWLGLEFQKLTIFYSIAFYMLLLLLLLLLGRVT